MVTHRFYLRQPRSSPWHCRTLTTDQGMILRWCWEAALPRTATLLDQSLWSSWGWPVKLLHQEYHSQLLHVFLSTFVSHYCLPPPRLWLSPWCHQIIQITVTKLFHLCKIICYLCSHGECWGWEGAHHTKDRAHRTSPSHQGRDPHQCSQLTACSVLWPGVRDSTKLGTRATLT